MFYAIKINQILFSFSLYLQFNHSVVKLFRWIVTSKASLSECILILSLSLLSSLLRFLSRAEIPLFRLLVVGGALPRFLLFACFGLLSLPLLSLSSPTCFYIYSIFMTENRFFSEYNIILLHTLVIWIRTNIHFLERNNLFSKTENWNRKYHACKYLIMRIYFFLIL